ncbi:RNA polymerase sigma factor 54 interaction domain protein [Acididesulfobacillus acetoxydans]|uniref:HTH-type transcriptional regulatory protein TyrR n=1 Tax=Acididesulfobacillus acetoxydans TaxID=1561005 RepID=A0A8S0WRM3_9FIRM|nr:sigma 54-interacting transcriptional regulator [Acididesulfobacillus acetoxydans]CAA7603394.1 RNA polymerase sigma factor 54 interaction domain protein [Acididesulfobacillus acetoxydans]CEJ08307.1 Acetoacetate metabolism regulatory protein AtoC [Acididesulfobacillus acetoxydans]
MDLRTFLRDPIFVDRMTSLAAVSERLRTEDHVYVFIVNGGEIFAVKSFNFLLGQQEPLEQILDRLASESSLKIIPFADLTERVLDVLAESVTLVKYEGNLKYILREDFLLTMMSTGTNSEIAWLRNLFASIPRGLMIVDLNYAVVNSNAEAMRMLRISEKELPKMRMHELFGLQNFLYVADTHNSLLNQIVTTPTSQAAVLVDFVPLTMYQVVTGFALVLQDLPSVEAMAMELDSVKQLNQDLEAILSTIYDELIVVDSRGKLLRASDHYISSQWQQPPNTLIGQQILKLDSVDELIHKVIREVQKKKRKVSLMQSNGDYPRLSVGNPLFHKAGGLERIVIASRDLTEVSRLRRELEQTRKQSEDYRQELERLRDRVTKVHGVLPIYASPLMHEVMQEVERVAQFSATVLLSGESGVGKEIIANTIHSLSERRDHPFVKINCAAIPDTLLESELFGYEKGAFSGASQQGKTGLIIKAHKGSLFLDEISELPPIIQGKLLRAIQEREVYPVGATVPLKFDIQIIAATNRSLAELVAQGKFREDLFYRINVFPITIPPLRERKEDIALLANVFLTQFNQTYKRSLRLSGAAIELLEAYPFPGNVRELQNLIQRIAIKNDGEVIDSMVVERILMKQDPITVRQPGRFPQVIPLEQAFAQVEEELVTLAIKQFHSTTKAAKALGVSQATVSRKYRQILNRAPQRRA